jgi:hypothetical protein
LARAPGEVGQQTAHDLTYTVMEGDKVDIVIGKVGNDSVANRAGWDPVITYIEEGPAQDPSHRYKRNQLEDLYARSFQHDARYHQITACAERFEIDLSSFGACHDLHGYRGIEKRFYHAFGASELESLPWPFAPFHGVPFGKQLVCS